MPREVIVALQIDSTSEFIPGGDVPGWTENRIKDIARRARILCPPSARSKALRRETTAYVNMGVLKKTIRSKTPAAGHRLDVGDCSVGPADQGGGDYTEFVLRGTAYQGMRYIYSSRGYPNRAIINAVITRRGVRGLGGAQVADLPYWWRMRFRTDGGKHYRVHGQKRNPFMTDAWNEVAALHPSALGFFRGPFHGD